MSGGRFIWFPPETTAKLSAQLQNAGPDARLELRLSGSTATLQVVMPGTGERAAIQFEPLNDSRVCPPICPG